MERRDFDEFTGENLLNISTEANDDRGSHVYHHVSVSMPRMVNGSTNFQRSLVCHSSAASAPSASCSCSRKVGGSRSAFLKH